MSYTLGPSLLVTLDLPSLFSAILVLQGLRWMVGLHDHQLNGILADEMVSLKSCLALLARFCMLLRLYSSMPDPNT